MAILTSQPHIDVKVIIEGETAEEYADNGSEPIRHACDHEQHYKIPPTKTVIKYIKSISDAVFKIQVRVDKKYDFDSDILTFWTWVDCEKKLLPSGHWVVLPYKFCHIKPMKEEELGKVATSQAELAQTLGAIEVLVYRTKPYGQSYVSTGIGKGAPHIVGALTEDAMSGRALTHSIPGEDPVKIDPPWVEDVDYLDGRDRPIARFIFRYRSREALQKLQIIETPVDHVEKLSIQELREKYRHSLSMNCSLMAIMDDEQVRNIKYESEDSADEEQARRKRKRGVK